MFSFKMKQVAVVVAMGLAGAAVAAPNTDVARALGHINGYAAKVAKSDGDIFAARASIVDAQGNSHVRFDRSYKGLRVVGGDVIVHSDSKGTFKSATHSLKSALNLNTTASVDDVDAMSMAEEQFVGARNNGSKAELVVWARGAQPRLAYEVQVNGMKFDGTPSEMRFIVDANSNSILEQWDTVHTAAAAATGKTLFSGNVSLTADLVSSTYNLRDPSRGNMYTTNMKNRTSGNGTIVTSSTSTFGNNTTSDLNTTAADAQYGTAVTWDYFKNVHGRNGIANDGKGAYNRVHYGRKYVNAFWSDSCFCMTYGDGDGTSFYPLDSLDVAGHEMTHGITSRTANLVYSGESGGLNEATSDIFGTLVEFYANNASDPGDYKIGEELYMNNSSGNGSKAMRFMYKPSLDGGYSKDCYYSGIGSIDVHYSSGVANRFFYFLAEGNTTLSGATCNGSNVSGIGRDAAGAIWYKALTQYMTSSTNYAGARAASISAATDIYGASSTQVAAVKAAWSAVSVN